MIKHTANATLCKLFGPFRTDASDGEGARRAVGVRAPDSRPVAADLDDDLCLGGQLVDVVGEDDDLACPRQPRLHEAFDSAHRRAPCCSITNRARDLPRPPAASGPIRRLATAIAEGTSKATSG